MARGVIVDAHMKVFKEGQKYWATSDGRVVSIARVVRAGGKRVTFEFSCGGKTRRHTARIRVCRSPASEVAVLADYDVIFAYNAL